VTVIAKIPVNDKIDALVKKDEPTFVDVVSPKPKGDIKPSLLISVAWSDSCAPGGILIRCEFTEQTQTAR
jgi:hypothetical protein